MGSPPSVGVPVRPTDLGVVASLPQHRGPSLFPTPIAGARCQPSLACLLSPMLQGEAGGGPCRRVALWTTQRPRGHCHREGKKTCHMWPVPYQADKWWGQWGGGVLPTSESRDKKAGGVAPGLGKDKPSRKASENSFARTLVGGRKQTAPRRGVWPAALLEKWGPLSLSPLSLSVSLFLTSVSASLPQDLLSSTEGCC